MKKQTKNVIAGVTIFGLWHFNKTKNYLSNLTVKTGLYLNNFNPNINTFVAQENTFTLRLYISALDTAVQPFLNATIKKIYLYKEGKEIAVSKEIPAVMKMGNISNIGVVFIPLITDKEIALASVRQPIIQDTGLAKTFESADVKIVWSIIPMIDTPIAYKSRKVSFEPIETITILDISAPQKQPCECHNL